MKTIKDKLWIDALDFDTYGQWKSDTQFTHLMGSGCLIACHTPGVPVKDAAVKINAECEGMYRVWIRARNWYYNSAPGKFSVLVDGKDNGVVLGALMSNDWVWQIAGDFCFDKGEHTISLHDLTGYFGRCSSVIITNDMNFVPKRPVDEFEHERAEMLGISLEPQNEGEWDVLVAGGGPGGVPAAIAAARKGMRTVLLTNRPLLGGNSSEEAGVQFNGASARQPNAREGGIAEELIRLKGHLGCTWTQALLMMCAAEPCLTVIYDMHIFDAQVVNNSIESVTARHTVQGTRHKYKAKMYIDSTGDSWLGYAAGAKYRIGREASWQAQEQFAPVVPDLLTMSGTLMRPQMRDTGSPVEYTAPEWVPVFPKGKKFGRNIEEIGMVWWAEAPNVLDDIYDAELARDEIFRLYLGYFNYLKNLWDEKEKAVNYTFDFMNHIDAKRESRRLIGDYMLTQDDCMQGKNFPDTVCHAGWPIDLHHPKGIYSGEEGPFFSNTHVPLVHIPYRCLYSVNINNLFMAGRNISVTHVALGTTRLQGTIANMGQAVGTAAALCIEKNIMPRTLGQTYLQEYRQILLKDDQYIPELKNDDENDLAKSCIITASSENKTEMYINRLGQDGDILPLDRQRATFMARGVSDYIKSIWLRLYNDGQEDIKVTIHVRAQADPDGYTTEKDFLVVTNTIKSGEHWVEYPIDRTVSMRYLWVWIEQTAHIGWRIWKYPPLDWTRSERTEIIDKFENMRNECHCIALEEPKESIANCGAENIINGFSRSHDAQNYCWVSDSKQELPQWINLKLAKKETINTVQITFDSDMTNNAMLVPIMRCPKQLVVDYTVEIKTADGWHAAAKVTGNYLRRRVHTFTACEAEEVRVNVTRTGGDKSARIFEVRLYNDTGKVH